MRRGEDDVGEATNEQRHRPIERRRFLRPFIRLNVRWLLLPLIVFLASSAFGANLSQLIETHLRDQFGGEQKKLVIVVNASAQQLEKARACQRLTAFSAPGRPISRRGYVGVQCADTPAWRMWIPVRLQRFGQLALTARALSRGSIVSAADLQISEGDISALPASAVVDPAQLIGMELTQSVPAGKSIGSRQLRRPRLVRRGDSVRVTINGQGYQASSRGVAVADGSMNDRVTVRMPSGGTLTGRVSGAGQLDVTR